MADPMNPLDTNNFEHDFEKLDPLVQSGEDDFGVSSTSQQGPVDDFFSAAPRPAPVAEPVNPLISLDDSMPSHPEPAFQPDSSSKTAAGEPAKAEPVAKKPQVSAAGGWLKSIDPRETADFIPPAVLDLIYWRDPKKTGIVFGTMMVLLLSLALFSVLSVVAYLSLAALTVTVSFRVYKNVLQAVQKTGEGHPFKQWLDVDINVSDDKVHSTADHVVKHASNTLRELRRLFLVEDLVDSLKFGLLLWVLTYIGAWFNGMTLIILATITVFCLPKFYETYKTQIDNYIDLARTQISTVMKQIQEKIPLPGKKKQN